MKVKLKKKAQSIITDNSAELDLLNDLEKRGKFKQRTGPEIIEKINVEKPFVSATYDPFGDDENSPYLAGKWNPYLHGITKSMLEKFLICPQKFKLSVVDSIDKIGEASIPMDFGNYFHSNMEAIYGSFGSNRFSSQFSAKLMKVVEQAAKEMYSHYKKEFNREGRRIDQLEKVYAMAEPVLLAYFRNWHDDFSGKIQWIAAEEVFDVPFIADTFPIRIRGKIDGKHIWKDGVWLREVKTKHSLDEDMYADWISIDIQCMIYAWAEWKESGKSPDGILYDLVRRPALKLGKNENLYDFSNRIDADIADRKQTYFARIELEITEETLINFEKNQLREIILQLERWWRGEFHYMNSAACKNGFVTCDYLPLCSRNQVQFYEQKRTNFRELEPAPISIDVR